MSILVKPSNTLVSVQVLRGIAAFLVVVHHAVTFVDERYSLELERFDFGAIGVDIFFVISGFIMFWTTKEHERSLAATIVFWKKRVVRIVPLYWIVTLVLAIALLFIPTVFRSMRFDLVALVKSLFFIPYANSAGLLHPMVDPGWTLNYEMYFYLVFGACLFFGKATVASGLCVLFFLFSVVVGQMFGLDSPILSTYTSPLLLEFCYGLICGYVYLRMGGLSMCVGLAMLVASGIFLWFYGGDFPPSAIERALVWGGVSTIVVFVCVSFDKHISGFSFMVLPRLIGDASYSIYLVHTLFFLAFGRVASGLGGFFESVFFFTAGAVVFGLLTYLLVERSLSLLFKSMRFVP